MSLKVGAIFMNFSNKYLLSIQLGSPRAWESNVSRAVTVPVLRVETLVAQARLPLGSLFSPILFALYKAFSLSALDSFRIVPFVFLHSIIS